MTIMDKKHWAVSVFWKLFARKYGSYLTFTALKNSEFYHTYIYLITNVFALKYEQDLLS